MTGYLLYILKGENPNMAKILLSVKGMSCQHCVRAIEQVLSELNGVQSAKVDLGKKEVTVFFDEHRLEMEPIMDAIQEEGYEIEGKQIISV